MPNLYFCQPHFKNQGMLRAVLSMEECTYVISADSMCYAGEQFPALKDAQDGAGDLAIVSIAADEADAQWRPGFYRCGTNLTELNKAIQKLAK